MPLPAPKRHQVTLSPVLAWDCSPAHFVLCKSGLTGSAHWKGPEEVYTGNRFRGSAHIKPAWRNCSAELQPAGMPPLSQAHSGWNYLHIAPYPLTPCYLYPGWRHHLKVSPHLLAHNDLCPSQPGGSQNSDISPGLTLPISPGTRSGPHMQMDLGWKICIQVSPHCLPLCPSHAKEHICKLWERRYLLRAPAGSLGSNF